MSAIECDSLILIADEHNNYLRKINYKNMTEEWHSPTFQLKSPGGIYLIEKGNFKGYYLISDTDNNRVILGEPIFLQHFIALDYTKNRFGFAPKRINFN